MKILTSNDDNFLYDRIIVLLEQIKLVQGGSALPPTLRRHKAIRNYLMDKQKAKINYIEETYFPSGELDQTAVESFIATHNK